MASWVGGPLRLMLDASEHKYSFADLPGPIGISSAPVEHMQRPRHGGQAGREVLDPRLVDIVRDAIGHPVESVFMVAIFG